LSKVTIASETPDGTFDFSVDCSDFSGWPEVVLAFKEGLGLPPYMGHAFASLSECLLEEPPSPSLRVLVVRPEAVDGGNSNGAKAFLATLGDVANEAGSADDEIALKDFCAVVVSDDPDVRAAVGG
jgi:hypothetical protein